MSHPTGERLTEDLLRPLLRTSWRFYALTAFFGIIVAAALGAWGNQMWRGFSVDPLAHLLGLLRHFLRVLDRHQPCRHADFPCHPQVSFNAGWRRPVTRFAEVITVIAPFASALSADVTVDGDDVGTGRLVLLHDPAGNDAWEGTFRCVAYARAEIDPEMANDPLLAEVGWSWLSEALDRARRDLPRSVGHGHQGRPRRASAAWPARSPAPSWRSAPPGRRSATRPGRPLDLGRTSRPGASCCAPPPACRRCPRASRRMPSRRGQRGRG